MALAVTLLTQGESTTTETSHNSANVSPSAGAIVVVCFSCKSSDAATQASETPQITNGAGSLNGTWSSLGTKQTYDTNNVVIQNLFLGTSASWGTAQPFQMSTAAARSQNRFQWSALQITGHDTGTPIINIVGAIGADIGATGGLAPALAAFGSVSNYTGLMGNSNGIADPTWTAEGSWTLLTTSAAVNRFAAYIGSNDTTPTCTYTPDTAAVGGYGFEIVAAGGAAATSQPPRIMVPRPQFYKPRRRII